MALCVCKCLNLTLECENCDDKVDVGKFELTAAEQRDIFFSEKLFACSAGCMKSQAVQPALVNQRHVGRWTLHSCLACRLTTHAVLHDHNNLVLVSKALITTHDKVSALKKSSNFSPVFHLLVPEVSNELEIKENIDTTNLLIPEKKLCIPVQQVIGNLTIQLNKSLESQLDCVEEAVRQFREQKFAEYLSFRERARMDHKILASVISKAQSALDNDGFKIDSSIDNGPPSPQLPPTQRRRLSSLKDAKKITQHFNKPSRPAPAEEDSLDAEDLFELEGTDSNYQMISDQDYDESDEESAEERPERGRGLAAADLARSLPINMPVFPADRPSPRHYDDDDEPQDIAASMKALARSVHGDVFEVPRPRFTTQI